ncbi:MAG: DNA polymerase III subunit alpha, partial [Oscillospiraceae bacterium]|nr:DNA polymerase III subunit alpha [Oscillospiraceae bacterium]
LDRDGGYIADNHPVMVWGKISLRDEKDPQLLVEQIRPMTDLEAGATLAMEPMTQEKLQNQKLFVRLSNQDDPALDRIRLILTMFPGNQQIILYLEDTKKKMTAQCVIHPALIQELTEMLGGENVVVK